MAHLNKLFLAAILVAAGTAAQADLTICNDTRDQQSVAIGFSADDGWTSEGWWNIDPGDCSVVLDGPLDQRYYYLRVEKDAGVFDGQGYFFCTQQEVFSIVGDTDCAARGYTESDFMEIDAGQNPDGFTYRLTQDAMDEVQSGVPLGLQFCNETPVTQAVALAYETADDEWLSLGWWVIDPQDCKRALAEPLDLRYYYYRSEVRGGDFDGDGYTFCTSPEVFDIVGDTECESRGYNTEDFREIDVGQGADRFRMVLTDLTGGRYDASDIEETEEEPVVVTEVPEETSVTTGLEFCNETDHVQAVSVGYETDAGWTSEGWWNVAPGECETPIDRDLDKRYYYYRAEVSGGSFGLGQYPFCTTDKAYEIVGDQSCESRGYETENFAEIDLGGVTPYHTVVLTSTTGGDVAEGSVADAGLRFCNETDEAQSVAIGYETDDGWTSAGWWNIEPGACETPLPTPLDSQYYYYRAEVDSGPFEGEGYAFCTTPEAFTIVGDTECEARGYDQEDFREIYISDGATFYTVALVPPMPNETGLGEEVTDTGGNATATDIIDGTHAGLEICNESGLTQDVALGYEGGDDWMSEGWWVIAPGECVTPALDGQRHRYLYYLSLSDGSAFEGQSYFFCTSPDAFTIVGDTDCEARGFERSDFRELDTGLQQGSEEMFRLALGREGTGVVATETSTLDTTPVVVTPNPTGGGNILGDRLGGENTTEITVEETEVKVPPTNPVPNVVVVEEDPEETEETEETEVQEVTPVFEVPKPPNARRNGSRG